MSVYGSLNLQLSFQGKWFIYSLNKSLIKISHRKKKKKTKEVQGKIFILRKLINLQLKEYLS